MPPIPKVPKAAPKKTNPGAAAPRTRGEGFVTRALGRLSTAGFTIQSWFDIFAQYFPHIKHTVSVKAQGGSRTQANRVVHTALAIAFGCMRQTRIGKIELSVTLDHTNNAVELEFSVGSLALVEALEGLDKILGMAGVSTPNEEEDFIEDVAAEVGSFGTMGILSPEAIKAAGRRLGKFLYDQYKKTTQEEFEKFFGGIGAAAADIQNKNKDQVPGIDRKGGPDDAGVPPGPPDNLKKAQNDEPANSMLRRALSIYRHVSEGLGQGVIWKLGRFEIRGGKAPKVLQKDKPEAAKNQGLGGIVKNAADQITGADTFEKLEGRVILTRAQAKNPQMPTGLADMAGGFGFGTDLRSLVAQVLHDPGVRPPIPLTDRGPVPVRVEEIN